MCIRDSPELYTNRLEQALKYYYIVGGMPEVAAKWVETHNIAEVERLQDNIPVSYTHLAPNFFECLTCPQYGKNCHPEVMKLDFQ